MLKRKRAPRGSVARVKQDLAIYRKARRLLANKQRWAVGTLAIKPATLVLRDGEPFETADNCSPEDPGAIKWCAVGALRRAIFESGLHRRYGNELREPLDEVAMAIYGSRSADNVVRLNDSPEYGHKAVLRVYDKVIEAMANTVNEGGK